jgi:hypothetical protein
VLKSLKLVVDCSKFKAGKVYYKNLAWKGGQYLLQGEKNVQPAWDLNPGPLEYPTMGYAVAYRSSIPGQ